MAKQEKQMFKSVRIAYGYGAGRVRMKKVYRDLYPRIKARKRIQIIEKASVLHQMVMARSFGLRYASTPQSPVSIYEIAEVLLVHDETQITLAEGLEEGDFHETH